MNIIQNAEQELRKLLSEAAAAGDYEAVAQVTAWARALAAITGAGRRLDPTAGTAVPERRALREKAPSRRSRAPFPTPTSAFAPASRHLKFISSSRSSANAWRP